MSSIPVVRTHADLRAQVQAARASGSRVALAPTMGALHKGHLSLITLAAARAEFVIASVFVNPTQFAPGEDFLAYPRDEGRDVALLATAGCHLVYAPPVQAIYPPGFNTTVSVAGVSGPLEGAVRPSHFSGVATVVTKLLIQVTPDVAVFGEKDYQQLQVVRRLALDLGLPVEIIAAPIVRDPDGLALSSRNAYLSDAQRQVAPALYRALQHAVSQLASGVAVSDVEAEAGANLIAAGFDAVDYFEVRGPCELERLGPGPLAGVGRILAAARLGPTRLIDNIAV